MIVALGGSDKKLTFGKVSFFKHAGEVWEGDPLELLSGVSNPKKMYDIVLAFIYAGLRCSGEKVEKDVVDSWVMEIDFDEAAKILTEARLAMSGGDGKEEAQSKEAVNA